MKYFLTTIFSFFIVITSSFSQAIPSVTIGSQTWMLKNLSVSTYQNGDPIPKVTDSTEWSNLTTGAWCWYNNDSATYAETYGRLYNFYAVTDPRGLAPSGWHVAKESEWGLLTMYAGAFSTSPPAYLTAGSKLRESGDVHWLFDVFSEGTNETGFTALPAGLRLENGKFSSIQKITKFWTTDVDMYGFPYSRSLTYNSSSMFRYSEYKRSGFSVRCVYGQKCNLNFNLNNSLDTIYSCNSSVTLNAGNSFNKFLWSNLDITQTTVVNSNGWYYCTVYQDSCFDFDSVYVKFSSNDVLSNTSTISGISDVCSSIGSNSESGLINYKINKINNASSYTWTVPTGCQIINGQGDTSINVKFLSSFTSGTITVKGSNNCNLNSGTKSLIVFKRTSATPTAIQKSFTPSVAAVTNVCGLTSETYRIKKVTYATSYNWSFKNGTYASIVHPNGSGINDTVVNITFLTGYTNDTLIVKSVTPCSMSTGKNIVLNGLATPPTVNILSSASGNFQPCINDEVEYTATSNSPSTTQSTVSVFRWTIPKNTSIISGNSDSSLVKIKYNSGYATGGIIFVKSQSACGVLSASKSFSLKYTPLTPKSITSSTTFNGCITSSSTFTAVNGISTTTSAPTVKFRWTIPANVAITNATNDSSSITVSFSSGYTGGTLSVRGISSCGVISVAKTQTLTHTSCPTGTKLVLPIVQTNEIKENTVTISPNPSVDNFNLTIISNDKLPGIIKVYSLEGHLIKSSMINPNIKTVFGNELSKGTYIIEVQQGNSRRIVKAVKI